MAHDAVLDVGALSAVTDAARVAALRLATRGQVYDLGVELSSRIPMISPAVFLAFSMMPYRTPEDLRRDGGMDSVTFHVEAIQGALHLSSHIDAFVHCQHNGRIYGGHSMADARRDSGWTKHGAETIPPIVTRGVVIDVVRESGMEVLPVGYSITRDELARAAGRQGVTVTPGTAVLVRTGKAQHFIANNEEFNKGCPGLALDAALWLHEQGMVAFGIDATSADPQPVPDWTRTVHVALLVERGVHILENLYLEDLARDGVAEFLFICLPLKLRGATGSWVRPIAVV
ncbi:MAG: cyclase family protein [Candidatus Latescibacteria bacterium]|nr:cyclase family protein [Candidatus Latescibacterota bacterium]